MVLAGRGGNNQATVKMLQKVRGHSGEVTGRLDLLWRLSRTQVNEEALVARGQKERGDTLQLEKKEQSRLPQAVEIRRSSGSGPGFVGARDTRSCDEGTRWKMSWPPSFSFVEWNLVTDKEGNNQLVINLLFKNSHCAGTTLARVTLVS